MMLMVENDHVDDFDAVSNEEDESLLFFFTMGQHPPAEQVGLRRTGAIFFSQGGWHKIDNTGVYQLSIHPFLSTTLQPSLER